MISAKRRARVTAGDRGSSALASTIPQTIAGRSPAVIRARDYFRSPLPQEREPFRAPTATRLAGDGSRKIRERLLYSREEAADLLSLSLGSIQELLHRGLLRGVRKGRLILIHREELERFAKEDTPEIWPAKVNGRTVRSHVA